jgi:ArsR family transcriptional regulator, arsenate/arsenite/antimonite-responsive transcriptional repressor
MSDVQETARMCRPLSVGSRVRIIVLRKRRPHYVKAPARTLQITPAAVSQHLRVHRNMDVVVAERKGYFVHYRLSEKTLAQWRKTAADLLEMHAQKVLSPSSKN